MRLIDAELLEIDFINKACGIKDKRTNRQIIDDAPTVDAIPVDFIRGWIRNYATNYDIQMMFNAMIDDWRKENEIN